MLELTTVNLTTKNLGGYVHEKGSNPRYLQANVVQSLQLPGEPRLNFRHNTRHGWLPGQKAVADTLTLPTPMAMRLAHFAFRNYVVGGRGSSDYSALVYVMGWAASMQYHEDYEVCGHYIDSPNDTEPAMPYYLRGPNGEPLGAMIGHNRPGELFGAVGRYNTSLAIVDAASLMRAYGAAGLYEVETFLPSED